MLNKTDALIDSVREVFKTMTSTEIKKVEKVTAIEFFQNLHISSMIGLAGNGDSGLITIHCSNECASKITNKMLGLDDDPDLESIIDAMGEIANMVGGSFKNKIIGRGPDELKLSLPSVVSGKDFKTHSSGKNAIYSLFTNDGHFIIELTIKE